MAMGEMAHTKDSKSKIRERERERNQEKRRDGLCWPNSIVTVEVHGRA